MGCTILRETPGRRNTENAFSRLRNSPTGYSIDWAGPKNSCRACASGTYTARVLDQDGKVQERAVRLGVRNRLSGEVLDGLREGELLVTGEQVAEGVSRFQL